MELCPSIKRFTLKSLSISLTNFVINIPRLDLVASETPECVEDLRPHLLTVHVLSRLLLYSVHSQLQTSLSHGLISFGFDRPFHMLASSLTPNLVLQSLHENKSPGV